MAGREGRSFGNIFIVSTIIQINRAEGNPTYAFFSDAVKCFDKLWLQDSLINTHKLGISSRDIVRLHKLKAHSKIVTLKNRY